MSPITPPLAARAYALAARAAVPALGWHLRRRAAAGREETARLRERRGEAAERPDGPLLWLHGASVGEALSAVPLLEALCGRRPDLSVLATTGTVTSARALAARLPAWLAPRVRHRYAPLDVPAWAARFLDGWRPDAGVFVESEVWPNLLRAARARGVPLALVNARMSPRSAGAWSRWAPSVAREALGAFRAVLAQSEADAARLRALGAPGAAAAGNLKYDAPPLPADEAEVARLRRLLAGRPVLLAASTHPGEEAVVARAHAILSPRLPGLLTVLVPRHPDRGAAVAAEVGGAARRSAGDDPPPPGGDLYVADTLGELGLFYRLAGVALVGRSLLPPGGGQNPLEPARLGCPVLLGARTGNFAEIAARLVETGGALRLPDAPAEALAAALADAAGSVLANPDRARGLREAAARVAGEDTGATAVAASAVEALLPPPSPRRPAA